MAEALAWGAAMLESVPVSGQEAEWAATPSWYTVTDLPGGAASPTPGHPLQVLSVKAPEGNGVHPGQKVTWVGGRVDGSVARVEVETSDGTLEATVAHGYFAAWWPGNDGDTAVVLARDGHGRQLARADDPTCVRAGGPAPRLRVTGHKPVGGCG